MKIWAKNRPFCVDLVSIWYDCVRFQMNFCPVPLSQAEGKILGHNIADQDGRRLLRKGRPLTQEDIQLLVRIGRKSVYVAELVDGDVGENEAARRVALAAIGNSSKKNHLRLVGPSSGRANLLSQGLGILRVDAALLSWLNDHEGLTIATLRTHTPVQTRDVVATVKIIPYAISGAVIAHVERMCREHDGALIKLDMLTPKAVSIIFSGTPSIQEKLNAEFAPLRARIEALGSRIAGTEFIPLEDESGEASLAGALARQLENGARLILLAGETAIMDRQDIMPRALVRAGGRVEVVGVPVDPGNLLMLGYLGDIPVLGAPGCARSKKTNIIDWVLPRLLAGDTLVRRDFIQLGHGGLLEDTLQRPMPRAYTGGGKRANID
jgi:molybdenum cofactor cytidylyltransferase